MANFELRADDAPPNVPDTPDFIPAAPPKWVGDDKTGPQPTKAANANDSGALWWDHDDPGQNGHQGYQGAQGVPGRPGSAEGGSTPFGTRFTITQTVNGSFTVLLAGGRGSPGGNGGLGGDGGEGQDGGDEDDEQPFGLGGQGGNGGKGGTGGDGRRGGDINEFDLTIGVNVSTSQVITDYVQGRGGARGEGGNPGNGGPGGVAGAGSGGLRQVPGIQGPHGDPGTPGKDGTINYLRVIA